MGREKGKVGFPRETKSNQRPIPIQNPPQIPHLTPKIRAQGGLRLFRVWFTNSVQLRSNATVVFIVAGL